ncbi:profilin-4 [Centroberyx affinis]|uniref:profilin-4 n=1 Tax=Centroberyx affinis TaxID=166261 RepID=UPI003A5BDDCB
MVDCNFEKQEFAQKFHGNRELCVFRLVEEIMISPQQAQLFTDSFKYTSTTREKGLHYQDRQYTCVRADHSSIYCKSVGHGLIIVKTLLYVLVATYNDNMYPSVCVEAVEKLAEYLREKGK